MRVIRQRRGLGAFVALILFTFALSAVGLWQVHRQYQVIAQGYEIDRDLFELRRLVERDKRLSLLSSTYKDPFALRAFAEEELGMHAPGRDDEFYIPAPADAARLATPSTPAPEPPAPPPPAGGADENP